MSTLTIGAISLKLLEDILEGAEKLIPPHTLRSETTHTGTDEGTQILIVAVNGKVTEITHLLTDEHANESSRTELFTLEKTPKDEWSLIHSYDSILVLPSGHEEMSVCNTIAIFKGRKIFFPPEVLTAQHMTLGTLQIMKVCLLQSIADD